MAFAVRDRLRSIEWLRLTVRRWRNPDLYAIERSLSRGSTLRVMQPYTTTSEDRYPALFDRLAAEMAGRAEPRILSFGCAGGEEVRALRRRMPGAHIVGVDVNPRAIARGRRRDRNRRSSYLIGDRPPPGQTFDAALALAVFRHGKLGTKRPTTCTARLPFAAVADAFTALDAAIRPGGLLAWGNAHFRLSDMPGGHAYVLVDSFDDLEPAEVLYGPDDRQLFDASDRGGLYRKAERPRP